MRPANSGRWSYKAGEKGRNRVRVYEKGTRGMIFAEVVERDPSSGQGQKRRVSLGHCDRERAKADAERMAVALREHPQRSVVGTTLDAVSKLYLEEVTPTKGAQKQAHDRRAVGLFLQCFGAQRQVAELDVRDWRRFVRLRRSGELCTDPTKPARAIGDRMITYDLKLLRAILTWATLVRENGRPLLDRNPLDGLPYPNDDAVARPVIEHDEYEKLLAAAPRVHALFELALVLAHETGHRVSAIRLLRWSDVTLHEEIDRCSVHWRAENDKIEFEHETPLTQAAVDAFRKVLRASPVIGESPVFPGAVDPTNPRSRHCFNAWWKRAEELAKITAVKRRRWHSLRRKWATETKTMPLKDQAHAGGWKSTKVLLDVYQRADMKTMREGLAKRSQLRQVAG